MTFFDMVGCGVIGETAGVVFAWAAQAALCFAGGVPTDDELEMAGGVPTDDALELTGEVPTDDALELTGGVQTDDDSELAGGVQTEDTLGLAGGVQTDDAGKTTGPASEGMRCFFIKNFLLRKQLGSSLMRTK